jgi:hypothetical protein
MDILRMHPSVHKRTDLHVQILLIGRDASITNETGADGERLFSMFLHCVTAFSTNHDLKF